MIRADRRGARAPANLGDPASRERVEQETRRALADVLHEHSARLLAGLVRRARGDFFRAEDALHDACAEALVQWTAEGLPRTPTAWLAWVAARRLVDDGRRNQPSPARFLDDGGRNGAADQDPATHDPASEDTMRDARLDFGSDDDTLRLYFTTCHPALDPISRIALTLNAVSGMPAAMIARAFLVEEQALAKRLVRAKAKIRDAGIAFRVPGPTELALRLPDVLKAIELIFNEGYVCSRGAELHAPELAHEGLRRARELVRLMPTEPECRGLLALVLFTHARSTARIDAAGNAVLLRDQNRALWDAAALEDGRKHLGEAVRLGGAGPFVLRAALSAEHALAASAGATRWDRIVELYDGLLELEPSPLIALNRAIAVGEVKGAAEMLAALEGLAGLDGLHYFHVARGDALARLGRHDEAQACFVHALARCQNSAESNSIRARMRPSSEERSGA